MPRERSENQKSTPNWNSSEAKITTSSVGVAAIKEKSATRRTCSRPLPPSIVRSARARATRLPIRTMSAIAGTRLATMIAATSAGVSKRSLCASPVTKI